MEPFAETLSLWYAEHGRRLPWRDFGSDDGLTAQAMGYRVWVSEVILQQTTVQQGLDYYYRFVERYPAVQDLAAASEDEVLRLWQGLGYYSRARNMRVAAQRAIQEGGFPTDYAGLLRLPGVGPYTAAAVASIAYGEPRAVVDGNVYRVLSRYFGMRTPIDTPAGQREYAELSQRLLDTRNPGRHNQALMDFGALQCRPRNPQCRECPLADSCQALAAHTIEELPIKSRRTRVQQVEMHYLLVHSPQGLWLRRRPSQGIWAQLWELVEEDDLQAIHHSSFIIHYSMIIGTFHHALTHRQICCLASAVSLDDNMPEALCQHLKQQGYRFVQWSELDNYALPKLIENIIETWRNKISE